MQQEESPLHPVTGKAVGQLSAKELHQQLVADAIAAVATPPFWFQNACIPIGEVDKIGTEAAFQRVRDEVASLGGFLPWTHGE